MVTAILFAATLRAHVARLLEHLSLRGQLRLSQGQHGKAGWTAIVSQVIHGRFEA